MNPDQLAALFRREPGTVRQREGQGNSAGGPGRPAGSRNGERTTPRWNPTKLNNMHEMVLDFMLINPHLTLKNVAREFQVTPSFMYMLVNSDLFQEKLREERGRYRSTVIANTEEKLEACAHLALDRLADDLENNKGDADYVLSAADKLTQRLGFGPKSGGGAVGTAVQQNNYYAAPVNQTILAEARAAMEGRAGTNSPAPALEDQPPDANRTQTSLPGADEELQVSEPSASEFQHKPNLPLGEYSGD